MASVTSFQKGFSVFVILGIALIVYLHPCQLKALRNFKRQDNIKNETLLKNIPLIYKTLRSTFNTRKNNTVNVDVLDVYKSTTGESTYSCVSLKTLRGATPICIYPVGQDRFISGSLQRDGQWEPHISKVVESILNKDHRLNFIDIGANLGVYSLIALKHNRRVLAVDANPINALHIRRSAQRGQFENMITIVVNALSDGYRLMKVRLPVDNNIGGAHVYNANKGDTMAVRSIYMDDLLGVINFDKAVLKIDVETSEPQAFSHSSKLFAAVDIPYIFMEWQYIKDGQGAVKLKIMLQSRGYTAFSLEGGHLGVRHQYWPHDILWKRTKHKIFPPVKD